MMRFISAASAEIDMLCADLALYQMQLNALAAEDPMRVTLQSRMDRARARIGWLCDAEGDADTFWLGGAAKEEPCHTAS